MRKFSSTFDINSSSLIWLNYEMWRGREVNTLSEFRGMYAGVLIHVLFPHTVTQYHNYKHPLVGDKRILSKWKLLWNKSVQDTKI